MDDLERGIELRVGAPEPDEDRAEAPTRCRTPRRWRQWTVTGAVVATLAVAGVAVTEREPPPVLTPDDVSGMAAAPAFPPGPVIDRWTTTLADQERLIGLGVHGTMVVAVAGPRLGGSLDAGRVVAWNRSTGRVEWQRSIVLPPGTTRTLQLGMPLVHVVDQGAATTVALSASSTGYQRGLAQVALRATDGTIAWRREGDEAPEVDGSVIVHPRRGMVSEVTRRLTSEGAEGSTTVRDLRTGREVFTSPGVVSPLGSRWLATPFEGDQYRVLDADGTVGALIVSDMPPAAVGDVIMSIDGTRVVGHDAHGAELWTADLDPARGMERSPGGRLLAVGDDTALVVVPSRSGGAVHEVTVDGRVRDLDPAFARLTAPLRGANLVIVVGQPMIVCTRLPGPSACPDRLALVGTDGTVRARSPRRVLLYGTVDASGLPGLATSRGLLVLEGPRLVLRRWQDLSEALRLDAPGLARQPQRSIVVPTGDGVAIGHVNDQPGQPDQVTWLS